MAASDYFCPSYAVAPEDRDKLAAWVDAQVWPQGTELKDPASYHVTAFYAREGYSDPANHRWLDRQRDPNQHLASITTGVETFDVGDGDSLTPVVVTLQADAVAAEAHALTAAAEEFGLKPLRHSDGYRPHVTVAMVPAGAAVELADPKLALYIGPVYEQHAANDIRKGLTVPAPAPTRPLLYLDVDGVLCLDGPDLPPHHEVWARGEEHFIAHGTAHRLARLAERFEMVWATEWGEAAHEQLVSHLELDADKPWRVLYYEQHKLPRILDDCRSRPWAWVDDDASQECSNFGVKCESPVIACEPWTGLTDSQVRQLLAFAERVDPR